jgi:hypothetical protein
MLRLVHKSDVRVLELAQLKGCDLMSRSECGQVTVFGKGDPGDSAEAENLESVAALRGTSGAVDPVFRNQKSGHMDISQIPRIVYAPGGTSGTWLRLAHASHALVRTAVRQSTWCRIPVAMRRCRRPADNARPTSVAVFARVRACQQNAWRGGPCEVAGYRFGNQKLILSIRLSPYPSK